MQPSRSFRSFRLVICGWAFGWIIGHFRFKFALFAYTTQHLCLHSSSFLIQLSLTFKYPQAWFGISFCIFFIVVILLNSFMIHIHFLIGGFLFSFLFHFKVYWNCAMFCPFKLSTTLRELWVVRASPRG